MTINLFEKWEPYKAANSAISVVSSKTAVEHAQTLASLRIPSGLLNIEKFNKYSSLILDYNRHLQWLTLHYCEGLSSFTRHYFILENKRNKKSMLFLQEVQATTKITDQNIFNCVLKLSHFEYKFKQTCNYLILHKEAELERLRRRVINVFEQIAVLLSSTALDHGNYNGKHTGWRKQIEF